eukprot:jgi/Psemu1/19593/gm1.19593_g
MAKTVMTRSDSYANLVRLIEFETSALSARPGRGGGAVALALSRLRRVPPPFIPVLSLDSSIPPVKLPTIGPSSPKQLFD